MKKSKKNIKSKVSKTKKLNKLLGGKSFLSLPNFRKGTILDQSWFDYLSELGVCKKIPKSDKKRKVSKPTFRKFCAVEQNNNLYLYYFHKDKNEYMGRLKVFERIKFENWVKYNKGEDLTLVDLQVEDTNNKKTTISLEFDNKDNKTKFQNNYLKFLESVKAQKMVNKRNRELVQEFNNRRRASKEAEKELKEIQIKNFNKKFPPHLSKKRSRADSMPVSRKLSRKRPSSGSKSVPRKSSSSGSKSVPRKSSSSRSSSRSKSVPRKSSSSRSRSRSGNN